MNGSRYQHSVCTVLDREKYSTLHTCGTKILPCEEDGVVVVLGVLGVAALLRVGPSTHLFQAARWVTTLDQAYGLKNRSKKYTFLKPFLCCSKQKKVTLLMVLSGRIEKGKNKISEGNLYYIFK